MNNGNITVINNKLRFRS